jgi:hypothetical protein
MTSKILQADGTYCYSGPNCKKHGGGAYHDRDGNPTSRANLEQKIEKALKKGQWAVYVAERDNLEKIDKEVAAMVEPSLPSPSDTTKDSDSTISTPSLLVTQKQEDAAWDNLSFYYPSGVSPRSMNYVYSNLTHFSPEDTFADNGEEGTLALYSALATSKGLSAVRDEYHFKKAVGDRLSISGVDGTTMNIKESRLILAKITAIEDHVKWRAGMTQILSADNIDGKVDIANYISYYQEETERIKFNFTKARFDFDYDRDKLNNDNYVQASVRMEMSVYEMQSYHDEFMFNKLKLKELTELLDRV